MILARFFYWIFKAQIDKLIFVNQSKKKGFEKLRFEFTDSKGMKYYRFQDDMDIPILRKGELERVLIEIKAGISKDELELIIKAMYKAINNEEGGRVIPNIALIGHLIEELNNRRELLIHPELLFESVAILYIREDEDPAIVDKEILRNKIEQLKKDSVEGLYDFFYTKGLSEYMPYLPKSEEELMAIYQIGEAKVKGMKTHLSSILGQESLII
jgi:hypothetical protein